MEGRGQDARFIGSVDDIVAHLARELREGDRVVILSNGGFGGIHGKLLAALAARRPPLAITKNGASGAWMLARPRRPVV